MRGTGSKIMLCVGCSGASKRAFEYENKVPGAKGGYHTQLLARRSGLQRKTDGVK